MAREIIRPSYGEPCMVQLACEPQGIQREGQSGIDFQYVLNSDQAITWLPKEARDAIVKSGAQNGDEICIRKSKRGRNTMWEVEVIEDETAAAAPPRTPSTSGVPRETRSETAVRRQAQTSQHISENGNGNGHAQPQPNRPGSQLLVGALCAAIDAATAATSYALSKGLQLQFETGDIRAMAATLLIESRKEAK